MITDNGLRSLTSLNDLTLMNNSRITDDCLHSLSHLRRFKVSYDKRITDNGLRSLTRLTDLSLCGYHRITDDGLHSLTSLTILSLCNDCMITDDGLHSLTNLTTLILSSNDMITDKGLLSLTSLTELDLRDNHTMTDNGLGTLTSLTILDLSDNEMITDSGLLSLEAGAKAVYLALLVSFLVLALAMHGIIPRAIVPWAVGVMGASFVALAVLEGMFGPIEFMEALGNIVSYVRLMAVGTASVVMALIANQMGALADNMVLGAVIAGLIHCLNLLLSVLSPSIQSMRLQYVEFFSKFYEGGGRLYRPFKKR